MCEAAKTFHSAQHRCRYAVEAAPPAGGTPAARGGGRPAEAILLAAPRGGHAAGVSAAAPQILDACNCNDQCPLSTWHCIEFHAECSTGAECACCWTSYCGSMDHCMLDCSSNECCSTPCGT